jgi:hypothetical protein
MSVFKRRRFPAEIILGGGEQNCEILNMVR